MNDPLAEDSMIVLRDMFPLMNEDLLYDTFMQNSANLQDTIDHLVSLENNDLGIELSSPKLKVTNTQKHTKQSSRGQQTKQKPNPDQNYKNSQSQYFQENNFSYENNGDSPEENSQEGSQYEEESSGEEYEEDNRQGYEETEKINNFLADEEYARQQDYFEKQQKKNSKNENAKFYSGKGGDLEKNRLEQEGYYNWEPLPGDLVNTILSETKNNQHTLRNQNMAKINQTIGNYNEFWKKNNKEKIKTYSNIKFNDDAGKDEDNFYFENMGLPANINENIDIDIFFEDE
jgi:hypothetical protein